MRTFLEYINTLPALRPAGSPPESIPSGFTSSANFPKPLNVSFADLTNSKVIDDINNHLDVNLHDGLITPYVGLERARKVLTPYGIVIQAVAWLNGEDGEQIFPIHQWGGLYGTNGVTKTSTSDAIDTNLTVNPELSVYFSWSYSTEKNAYDIYCAVVNQEDLNDLLYKDFDGTPFDDQDDIEAAMSEACWDDYKQVGMKKKGKRIVPNCVPEESAAWQRKEGKNPEGGLNQKGVASYRRENPGSKLKTAVTTPPSKLDPDSKSAKRRKSFCARMGGMEGPMKDEKGRPTRKALSLRKWNC